MEPGESSMKLGLGLYRHMLTPENFRFARQPGARHIAAHWVNYLQKSAGLNFPSEIVGIQKPRDFTS